MLLRRPLRFAVGRLLSAGKRSIRVACQSWLAGGRPAAQLATPSVATVRLAQRRAARPVDVLLLSVPAANRRSSGDRLDALSNQSLFDRVPAFRRAGGLGNPVHRCA